MARVWGHHVLTHSTPMVLFLQVCASHGDRVSVTLAGVTAKALSRAIELVYTGASALSGEVERSEVEQVMAIKSIRKYVSCSPMDTIAMQVLKMLRTTIDPCSLLKGELQEERPVQMPPLIRSPRSKPSWATAMIREMKMDGVRFAPFEKDFKEQTGIVY